MLIEDNSARGVYLYSCKKLGAHFSSPPSSQPILANDQTNWSSPFPPHMTNCGLYIANETPRSVIPAFSPQKPRHSRAKTHMSDSAGFGWAQIADFQLTLLKQTLGKEREWQDTNYMHGATWLVAKWDQPQAP